MFLTFSNVHSNDVKCSLARRTDETGEPKTKYVENPVIINGRSQIVTATYSGCVRGVGGTTNFNYMEDGIYLCANSQINDIQYYAYYTGCPIPGLTQSGISRAIGYNQIRYFL